MGRMKRCACMTAMWIVMAAAPVAAEEYAYITMYLRAPEVGRVSVAGEFNQWDPFLNPMEDRDKDGVWETLIRMPHGRQEYKFVVDGTMWIADPANPLAPGQHGNSVIYIDRSTVTNHYRMLPISAKTAIGADTPVESGLRMRNCTVNYVSRRAKSVDLLWGVDEFKLPGRTFWPKNAVQYDTDSLIQQMARSDTHTFTTSVTLPEGTRFFFAFLVRVPFDTPPNAYRDGNGNKNGNYAVTLAHDMTVEVLDKMIDYTFQFAAPAADTVNLVWVMNRWDTHGTPLKKDKKGIWRMHTYLPLGRFTYRFYVNNRDYYKDPAAPTDEAVAGKSVLMSRVDDDLLFSLSKISNVIQEYGPGAVDWEVNYFSPFAEQMYLVWSVDGRAPDKKYWDPQTSAFNKVLSKTLMTQTTPSQFQSRLQAPYGSKIDFMFHIVKPTEYWDYGEGRQKGYQFKINGPTESNFIGIKPDAAAVGGFWSSVIQKYQSLALVIAVLCVVGVVLYKQRNVVEIEDRLKDTESKRGTPNKTV